MVSIFLFLVSVFLALIPPQFQAMENHTVPRQKRVSVTRDFPPGFGRKDRNPTGVNSYVKRLVSGVRDFPPGCGPNATPVAPLTVRNAVTGDKVDGSRGAGTVVPTDVLRKEFKKELGYSKVSPCTGDFSWRRHVGAVKSKPVTGASCSKNTVKNPSPKGQEAEKGESEIMGSLGGDEDLNRGGARENVLLMCKRFRDRCSQLFHTSGNDKERRIDYQAWKQLTEDRVIEKKPNKRIGNIPGINIGDHFEYRIELVIVGLHSRTQNGIDHIDIGGFRLASCVVATEGYYDKMTDCNVLLYTGEGGGYRRDKVAEDQKMSGGNLALYNSYAKKSAVRVVRGLKKYRADDLRPVKTTYIYDGLYEVSNYEKKKGPLGNMIYEFELTRLPGQSTVNWKRLRV